MNPFRVLKTRGLRGTANKVKEKLLYREIYEYTCSLEQELPAAGENKLIPAESGLLKQMFARHPQEIPERKQHILLERLEKPEETCLLICGAGGEICGYCHTAYSQHLNTWSNYLVVLAPGQVYLFDDYVFTPFRGRGLHQFSIARRMNIAREQGYTNALTIIEKNNAASHAAYTRLGFRRTKLLWHLPLLNKTVPRKTVS